MPKYTTEDIRNLAMVGSAGGGKTTLVELMLNKAGVIGRAGRVEDGNTVCDYDDLEKDNRLRIADWEEVQEEGEINGSLYMYF